MPQSSPMAETEAGENAQVTSTAKIGTGASRVTPPTRRDRRMAAKKGKRKKKRQEMGEVARREEENRMNDPEEQLRLQAEEEMEKRSLEKARMEFEERERRIMEEWERSRAEQERIRAEEEEESIRKRSQNEYEEKAVDEDDWEYVEEGPPEILWQGNEIIVKKKKIKVKREDAQRLRIEEDPNRPTSNPFPPDSEAFDDSVSGSVLSAQDLLDNVAQETPNFGTEQDKAHCPFHLKTGACRFGTRCSRIHFYPNKSCTLLIKNMYSGPGLAWEQDEGLEHNVAFIWLDVGDLQQIYLQSCGLLVQNKHTDEEVEKSYEEFYEDVHTEFLKFGEILNFKVCRNGLSHLRGNVYVHYKSQDSATAAFQFMNGRYFAGKQVLCEFVGITRWKVAICGEFMKSKHRTCSRGISCNFIHPFRNPGGDYEWADWDKPAPRHWQREMAVLFGTSDEQESPRYGSHRSHSPESVSDTRRRRSTSLHREQKHSDDHFRRQSDGKSRWRDEPHHARSPPTDKDTNGRSRKHAKGKHAGSPENGKHLHTRSRGSNSEHGTVNGWDRENDKGLQTVDGNPENQVSNHTNDRRSRRSHDMRFSGELKRKPDADHPYDDDKRRRQRAHSKDGSKKPDLSHEETDVYNMEGMIDRWEPTL